MTDASPSIPPSNRPERDDIEMSVYSPLGDDADAEVEVLPDTVSPIDLPDTPLSSERADQELLSNPVDAF